MGAKRSEEEWVVIIEDYHRSGMSLRAYAKENGINQKTLSNHTRSNRNLKSKQRVRRRNLDEWRTLFRDQVTSGLSVSVWCEEKGISVNAMRDAERKIRTADGQNPQNWVRAHVAEETKASVSNEGRLLIRFSDFEIEAAGSYPPQNIAVVIDGLRRS
jgi:hypothetical protein